MSLATQASGFSVEVARKRLEPLAATLSSKLIRSHETTFAFPDLRRNSSPSSRSSNNLSTPPRVPKYPNQLCRMILRKELRKSARARLRDAEVLFRKQRYDGAYYLCGGIAEGIMNLKTVSKKLQSMATEIESEKGEITLFALFLRNESPELWDLGIAAEWIKDDKGAVYMYVANKLQSALTEKERYGINSIVILNQNGAALHYFLEQFGGKVGMHNIHFQTEGGKKIPKACVILVSPSVRAHAKVAET